MARWVQICLTSVLWCSMVSLFFLFNGLQVNFFMFCLMVLQGLGVFLFFNVVACGRL